MFERNVGLNDRGVRIVLGAVLVALALIGPKVIWGWIGLYPIITGIVGFCPPYRAFKISTVPAKHLKASLLASLGSAPEGLGLAGVFGPDSRP